MFYWPYISAIVRAMKKAKFLTLRQTGYFGGRVTSPIPYIVLVLRSLTGELHTYVTNPLCSYTSIVDGLDYLEIFHS